MARQHVDRVRVVRLPDRSGQSEGRQSDREDGSAPHAEKGHDWLSRQRGSSLRTASSIAPLTASIHTATTMT